MPKDKIDKFKKYFTRVVFTKLEKNCVTVCDPSSDNIEGPFRKMSYKLPQECERFYKDSNQENPRHWVKVLENVSLENIHLHYDVSKGRQSLKNNIEGISAADLFDNDSIACLLKGGPL
jgi:hypothetical protein